MSAPADYDVVIAGGGLVGASLALALAPLGLNVALVEASIPSAEEAHASFDERTTALSNGSRRTFEALGVWPLVEREATPIKRIHVSNRGRFGFARLSAEEEGLTALGYVVTNRVLGQALWRRLAEERIEVIAPARVTAMQLVERGCEVRCEQKDVLEPRLLRARLSVAADGAQSALREAAGIASSQKSYEQVAITTNVLTQRFHEHVAYERFTADGLIAMLPISEGRCGVVWAVSPPRAAQLLALPDAEFLSSLQEAFGFRLGRLLRVGARATYPLALMRSDACIAPRLAIIGNAAQSMHPIAGQGFNLGLRDAAALAEVLADGRAEFGASLDAGDGLLLERYRAWRDADRTGIIRFTDGLVRTFALPLGPLSLMRDIGLLAFDLMPTAKHALSQLSLGAAGRVPRLSRGAPLQPRRP
jgi:2-octaprenyl-6-methoxyphenol hydroxylase